MEQNLTSINKTLSTQIKQDKEKVKEGKRKKETTDDRATTHTEKERESVCMHMYESVPQIYIERERRIEEAFNTTEGKTMSESFTSFHILQL